MKRFTLAIVVSSLFGVTTVGAQTIERSQLSSANLGAPLPVSPFGTMSYPLFPATTTWHGYTKPWGYGSPYGNVIPSIAFLADDDKGAPKNCSNNTAWNKHLGTDYAAPAGTPVYAIADGKVRRVWPFTGIGDYYVVVESGSGEKWTTLYGHLNRPPFDLNKDQSVSITKGQLIGTLYNYREGGDVPHLHLGIRLSPYVNTVNANDPNSSIRGYACQSAVTANSNYKFTSPESLRYITNYWGSEIPISILC